MTELVQNPAHYHSDSSGVGCIDIIEHLDFCLGSAVKYCWRIGLKPNETERRELEKAKWYLNRALTNGVIVRPVPDEIAYKSWDVCVSTENMLLVEVLTFVVKAADSCSEHRASYEYYLKSAIEVIDKVLDATK